MDSQLRSYVKKIDDVYGWNTISTVHISGVIIHVIELISQRWLTEEHTNRCIWKHILHIYIPNKVSNNKVFLRVSSDNKPHFKRDNLLLKMVKTTGSITAKLFDIPNQPIIFKNDPAQKARIEDSAMAYSWKLYCENPSNCELLINFPMVKSVIMAMNMIDEFSSHTNNYVLMGASKRGLTVWLSSIVDIRIVAIVPLVFDALNLEKTLGRQISIYGKHGDALADYDECGLLNHDKLELLKIIDPYTYLNQITIPKYLINSTGDKFFLPDSSTIYFGDIIGSKYLCYVPNSDHNLHKLNKDMMITFYGSVIHNIKLPDFCWQIKNNKIAITVNQKPNKIKLWHAINKNSRDFRSTTANSNWISYNIKYNLDKSNEYIPILSPGWNAYFVELTYNDLVYKDKNIVFTTDICIVYSSLI